MATKPEHHEAVRNFVKSLKPPLKLSLPALETLAVIAYKQPVTGPEIMEIRGVQGAGVLKTLLDRKLIAVAGRKNVIGKPILYKTTKEFLIQFGLKDLSELPSLKEFEEIRRMALSDGEMADPRDRRSAARRSRAEPAELPPNRSRNLRPQPGAASQRKLMPEERLQKILSHAGVASRRRPRRSFSKAGSRSTARWSRNSARKADLEPTTSRWTASCCAHRKQLVYIALNKPNNYVTTVSDPEGRADRNGSAPRREGARLSRRPAGLSQRRAAAADQRRRAGQCHHVRGHASSQNLSGEGERPADGGAGAAVPRGPPSGWPTNCAGGPEAGPPRRNPWYEVRLIEGRKNQIRLMFKHLGRLVEKLKRVRIGPLDLGSLKPGAFRHLTDEEVAKLKRASGAEIIQAHMSRLTNCLRNSPVRSPSSAYPASASDPATVSRNT